MKALAHLGRGVALLLLVSSTGVMGNAPPDLRLVEAVKTRNPELASRLVKQQVDVNTPEGDGATALHWAAHWDDLETADLLVRSGANVNATNDYGVMPLFLAAVNGNALMVEKLLKAGANAAAALPTGETVLMRAAHTGNVDAVRALLAHGADVNAKQTSKGQTALMWAVSENHLEVARTLIESGAEVGARSNGGFTPLLFAAREGHPEMARLLLAHGADVNETAPAGSTPLLVAAVRGHVTLAKFLLDQGANPEGNASVAGYTPLHWAAGQVESQTSVDYVVESGEWSALAGVPTREGKLELINALLAHGANINTQVTKNLPRYGYSVGRRNSLGGTPFYLATAVADVEMMRLLVARGADPRITAKDKTTPLIVAAGIATNTDESSVPERAHLEAVKVALELGNDLEATNDAGWSAMHAAALTGYDSVVQFLADQGAKLSEMNKAGQTPLGITEGFNIGFFQQRPSTAALLRKLGAESKGAVTLDAYIEGQIKNPFGPPEQDTPSTETGTRENATPGAKR